MNELTVFVIGALVGAVIGAVMVFNRDLLTMPKKRNRSQMATRDLSQFLYGRSKVEWFWRRAYDEDDTLSRLPLREYAKHYSSLH